MTANSPDWDPLTNRTTDLFSPNKKDLAPMGAPRYLKVCLMSMICYVALLAATNSEPYVAVSTVACFWNTNQQVFC